MHKGERNVRFAKLKNRFIKFMYGRYGVDKFGKDMLVAALVLSFTSAILSLFAPNAVSLPFSALSFAFLIFIFYRAFSKNINKRVYENNLYINKTEKLRKKITFFKTRFNDRKKYKYVKCTHCKNYCRVPRKKGKIKITCRVCKNQFVTKT